MAEEPKSNFRIFAENVGDANVETDNEYEVDSQRNSGVVPGIADPRMHNKLYKQATIMVAAIAQVIVQAGFNALDNDYSGLVSNIRQAFAGSVNGVKPDAQGNIDLTEVLAEIRRMTYPRVGDFIITRNPENPSKKYDGTTWELLKKDTFIMSAETGKAGEEGGSNSHSNSLDEMTPHAHKVTVSSNGGHNHGRGTMNITGTLCLPTHTGRWNPYITGAFWAEPPNGDMKGNEGADFPESWRWHDIGYATFDASRSWTGRTSTDGSHAHDVMIRNTGMGKPYDIRPRYISAYIWIRTA